ncbi:MAG: hypothetical protein ACOY33_02625 [Pseudomonadota bacterium]
MPRFVAPTAVVMPVHARLCALLLAALLAAGCSPYKFAGDQLMKFGEKEIFPHELAGNDLEIGCVAATGFTIPAIAFERVGTNVDQIGILLQLTSGVCTEFEGLEHELTYLRAMYAEKPFLAQDARIAQKRAHALAAQRQYLAYQRFLNHYGDLKEGQCPKFRKDFDELVFMVGLLAGMQAMINDAQAGQFNNVPRDIAPKVGYLVNCIDSAKWWDVPRAVQAALWHIAPMLAPPGVEPMKTLEEVARRGERDGVRLGHVIWAMTAYSGGDKATTRKALRDFAAAGKRFRQNAEYRILDTISRDVMLALSDRMWTEATGHRTPHGALGTFWDDPAPPAPKVDDDLFE